MQRVEETLGPFACVDREVRPRRSADEERVAGENKLVAHHEAAVLRTVAGRGQILANALAWRARECLRRRQARNARRGLYPARLAFLHCAASVAARPSRRHWPQRPRQALSGSIE